MITSYVDYVPNPGYPSAPPSPCVDPQITPAKVCGTMTPPGPGESEEVNYLQINAVNASGAAQPLTSSTVLAHRAMLSAPSTNTADVNIGPDATATADVISPGMGGFEIPAPDGIVFDLNNWYFRSAAAGQKLTIQYLPG